MSGDASLNWLCACPLPRQVPLNCPLPHTRAPHTHCLPTPPETLSKTLNTLCMLNMVGPFVVRAGFWMGHGHALTLHALFHGNPPLPSPLPFPTPRPLPLSPLYLSLSYLKHICLGQDSQTKQNKTVVETGLDRQWHGTGRLFIKTGFGVSGIPDSLAAQCSSLCLSHMTCA